MNVTSNNKKNLEELHTAGHPTQGEKAVADSELLQYVDSWATSNAVVGRIDRSASMYLGGYLRSECFHQCRL